ncbi:MAG: hypothetical protein ACXADY_24800, partial [Candidatus Hodarchaeales archaeon]
MNSRKTIIIQESDLQVIEELQEFLGRELPIVTEITKETIGYLVKDRRVIGLSLYNCKLEKLPMSLKKLKSLQIINLSQNNLEHLPPVLQNLKELRKIDLSHNPLTFTPDLHYQITEKDIQEHINSNIRRGLVNDEILSDLFIEEKLDSSIIKSRYDIPKINKSFIADNLLLEYQLIDSTDIKLREKKVKITNNLLEISEEFRNLGELAPFHSELRKMEDKEIFRYCKENLKQITERTTAFRHFKFNLPKKNVDKFINDSICRLTDILQYYSQDTINSIDIKNAMILLQTLTKEINKSSAFLKKISIALLQTYFYYEKLQYLTKETFEKLNLLQINEIKALEELEKTIETRINLIKNIKTYKNRFGVQIQEGHIIGLKIADIKLNSLPESTGELKKLENLNLKGTYLETLPASFSNLTTLLKKKYPDLKPKEAEVLFLLETWTRNPIQKVEKSDQVI